jgi:hypothetical protein
MESLGVKLVLVRVERAIESLEVVLRPSVFFCVHRMPLDEEMVVRPGPQPWMVSC